jgi:hypothetical protein
MVAGFITGIRPLRRKHTHGTKISRGYRSSVDRLRIGFERVAWGWIFLLVKPAICPYMPIDQQKITQPSENGQETNCKLVFRLWSPETVKFTSYEWWRVLLRESAYTRPNGSNLYSRFTKPAVGTFSLHGSAFGNGEIHVSDSYLFLHSSQNSHSLHKSDHGMNSA